MLRSRSKVFSVAFRKMSVADASNWNVADSKPAFDARCLEYQPIVQSALNKQLISEEEPVIDLFDLDVFRARLQNLTDAFGEDFITHGLSIKAQPLAGILNFARKNFKNVGIEGASYQEVLHGFNIGFDPSQLIFDSPVKPKHELIKAMEKGFYINLDNIQDMETVDEILKEGLQTNSKFGIRLNPLVGEGTIAASSTAGISSKFGLLAHKETIDTLVNLFKKYPFVQGYHCHVGSQGIELEKLVAACKQRFFKYLYDFKFIY